jgi:hypothetical protein
MIKPGTILKFFLLKANYKKKSFQSKNAHKGQMS